MQALKERRAAKGSVPHNAELHDLALYADQTAAVVPSSLVQPGALEQQGELDMSCCMHRITCAGFATPECVVCV